MACRRRRGCVRGGVGLVTACPHGDHDFPYEDDTEAHCPEHEVTLLRHTLLGADVDLPDEVGEVDADDVGDEEQGVEAGTHVPLLDPVDVVSLDPSS